MVKNNGKTDHFIIRPIGTIKNNNQEPFLVAGNDGIKMKEQAQADIKSVRQINEEISEIVINEDIIDILDGIRGYSHLVILYWAHKVPEQSRSLTKVHPMGRECFSKAGIFSTCSPARPNPILMTVVRLCGIRDNVLEVTGLDAVNGSPLIDIKPYVRNFYPQDKISIPKWMQDIQKEFEEGSLKNL